MQLSKIDLSSFHDFPPQPSAHTALCLSLNAKGRAFHEHGSAPGYGRNP